MSHELSGLDAGIAPHVAVLRAAGVETFESCEGGSGHAFPEPTVRVYGTPAAGHRALAVCLDHGLPVMALRRVWYVENHELTGPTWELTFSPAIRGCCKPYSAAFRPFPAAGSTA
jgi:hypothetical protein